MTRIYGSTIGEMAAFNQQQEITGFETTPDAAHEHG